MWQEGSVRFNGCGDASPREACETLLVEYSGGLSALLRSPHGVDAASDVGLWGCPPLSTRYLQSLGGSLRSASPQPGLGDGAAPGGDLRAEAMLDIAALMGGAWWRWAQ